MSKLTIKAAALLIISILIFSGAFSACARKTGDKQPVQSTQTSKSDDAAVTTGSGPEQSSVVYPIDTDKTLTYWGKFHRYCAQHGTNLAGIELYKELEKRTGVKIEFLHPATGQEDEQFNLLIASGDLPDMIEHNWLTKYPGGPENAITDGVITPLNDLVEKYAPNLRAIITKDPNLAKEFKTDSGNLYVFPFLRGAKEIAVFMGPMLRKDWLDELGLQIPETIDEWYNVLKAFKAKGVETPLALRSFLSMTKKSSCFVGAYGIKADFYIENGEIVYGPIQPAFKDYLSTMRKWYVEGLLDQDFATTDNTALNAKLLSSKVGAVVAYAGGNMGIFLDSTRQENPEYDLIGAPNPVLNKGDRPKFGHLDPLYSGTASVAITADSKNKELCAHWLDYAYGEEGHMLFNFGIEGVSYVMENGYPRYTELITNNPNGLTMADAMGNYMRSQYDGPFVQDKRYHEQYTGYEQQKDAIAKWTDCDEALYQLPQSLTPSQEESSEYTVIMNEINTYCDEMIIKFILGIESLDNFDNFVKQIEAMGIEKAIKIKSAALERYNNR
jgi:putative aldouronate transport system substrate-binding protein